MSLRVSLAGRVSISNDGVLIEEERLPGRQGRLVFVYLASEHGRLVTRDELAEALWGEAPPARWEKALGVIASKLRALLGECGLEGATVLTSAFGCYRLELPRGTWVDTVAAARAADEAEAALIAGDAGKARAKAATAASLARPPLLPGEDGAWVEGKRRELAGIHIRALESLAEACLRLGDATEAAKRADEAIALEPFRESGYRHVMRAHAAAGNTAEALRVYERCRRLLAEELGAYPSPETESIYRGLLKLSQGGDGAVPVVPSRQAEASHVFQHRRLPAPAPEKPSRGRAPPAFVLAASLALVGAALASFILLRGGEKTPAVVPNSVVKIDPKTNEIIDVIRVSGYPLWLAAVGQWVFSLNVDGKTVTRIDTDSGDAQTVGGFDSPRDLAVGADSTIWVATGREAVQIDAETLAVVDVVRVPANTFAGVAQGGGSLWLLEPGSVLRLSLARDDLKKRFALEGISKRIVFGAGAAWISMLAGGELVGISADGEEISRIAVGPYPGDLAVGFGAVWVVSLGAEKVYRVETATGEIDAIVRAGDTPWGVSTGPGEVWITNEGDGTVSRIDPKTDQVVATIEVGHRPHDIAVAGGSVWVAVSGTRWPSREG